MSMRRLPIPNKLHQIKAQQIYEKRIAKGRSVSAEGDWETARRYLTRYPKVVRAWKRKQAIAFYRQQLNRSFLGRLWQSFKALTGIIWKIITFPFWLFNKLPQLFTNTDTRPFALDVVKTVISAASLIAAIIAAIGLFFNIREARHDREDARQDRQLTQERLITDRFTKAVAQLGNSKEEVIIGGIYSLERIAKDSPKDQWTIMEVLTAFVRKNSPIPAEIQKLEDEEKLEALEKLEPFDIHIQAALTVIGRRDPEKDDTSDEDSEQETKILDLSNTNLIDADLFGANLESANLESANLRSADLRSADLESANLESANLRSADLRSADLSRARLRSARLRSADLRSADLSRANLFSANLSRANLRSAKLERADLSRANLNDANLRSANLSGANLRSANLSGANLFSANLFSANLSRANLFSARLFSANLSGANLNDANLSGANLFSANLNDAKLGGADLSGANLSSANLESAKNLSNQQIKSGCSWEKAIFTDAKWHLIWITVDEKANQARIREIKQDKASDPINQSDCP